MEQRHPIDCPAVEVVMTLMVNQNGGIYEKDLGPGSTGICAKMTAFDPGPGWKALAP